MYQLFLDFLKNELEYFNQEEAKSRLFLERGQMPLLESRKIDFWLYCVIACKMELDQIMEGVKSLKMEYYAMTIRGSIQENAEGQKWPKFWTILKFIVKGEENKGEKLMGEDVRSGLTCVISMKVPEPEFVGQTKDKLGNTEVATIVNQIVKEKLTLYFEQNPQIAEIILKKAMDEARARIAARKAKDNMRKKTMSDGFGLPEKLSDCSLKNPEICEVYIVEGDSAGGSAKKGRDPKTQAILPLWGKMLNVEKVRPEKVMNNDKLTPVIASLGTGFGKDFNIEKLRYHKIIIMADADVDGSHIRTLLLTFFFRYMPQLIENGHIYLAMPPLYKVQAKGKGKEPIYCYSDAERDAALESLGEERDKADIQRYKGLGEMDADQLWETTMDPERRTLKRVTIEDAYVADALFSVLMGDKVEPRREFIEANAKYADNIDV